MVGAPATRPRAPWWCRWGGVILLVAACLLPEASAQLNGYRRVHSWGSNRFGELGIDHVEGQASQAKENQCDPQFVPTLGHEALGPEGANLQRIVSGQNHVVAVTQEGDMYVWGRNDTDFFTMNMSPLMNMYFFMKLNLFVLKTSLMENSILMNISF